MPFGLCNAPATFQRLMERCMGTLNLNDCLISLDDIIIFSSSFEQHLERLESVFQKLSSYNLKLKPSKCEFFKTRVTDLGHIVSENGIETDPEKISVVTSWPVAKTIKQGRSFLGFSGFYRRLLKNYAGIARPLNDLLVGISNKKDKRKRAVPFHWGESPQNASDELKRRLSSAPILAYADIIKNHTKSILLPPPVDLALCFIIRRTMWIVSLLMQVEVCVQLKENTLLTN